MNIFGTITMIITIIIFAIPFVIGILMTVFGIKAILEAILKLTTYNKTIGRVVSFYRTINAEKGEKLYPIFEYTALGKTYMQKSENGYYSKECKYEVGQDIKIYYNPKDTDKYHQKGLLIKMLFVGILLLVVGGIMAYFFFWEIGNLIEIMEINL